MSKADLSDAFAAWHQALSDKPVEDYRSVSTGTGTLDIGDPSVQINVLGPRVIRVGSRACLPDFGDAGKTINGHSVVLRLMCGEVSILLPGDINAAGSKHISEDQAVRTMLGGHVFKAPHHGSHDIDPQFLGRVRPQVTVISSGDEPDHGHPRASLIGLVGHHSRSDEPLVFSTEIAATFQEADQGTVDAEEAAQPGTNANRRVLFKKRLHGMINVRTDGTRIYAARRVAAGYWWESYGPLEPAP